MLRAGRSPLPQKITSSMPDARMLFDELSPMTQRSASTRFDLPHPFGPTMPVSPGSIKNSAGSTKVLKPAMRSFVSFMVQPLCRIPAFGSFAIIRQSFLAFG